METTRSTEERVSDPAATVPERMPWLSLILLTTMGFILVTVETMPAGLLSAIAGGLRTSESTVGLLISAYALGTIVVTAPAITLTGGLQRKPLLIGTIVGLVAANAVTAFSSEVALSLASRVVAGACSGIIWGMFASYARKDQPASAGGAVSCGRVDRCSARLRARHPARLGAR
jgi:predicted MFS family arabinose efflux permease